MAHELEPDPRGFGTHQGLGLPPCTIRALFGVPCPSCGMTTSFSLFTRGRVLDAAQANLAGMLLAGFCVVQVPWCWASSVRGRLWGVSRPENLLVGFLLTICTICLAQWLLRLLT